MAVGKQLVLSDDSRARIERAVQRTEKSTGLQFLVYLGKAKGDPRVAAEKLLVSQGYASVPGVVVLVAPDDRRVEVKTSELASKRLPDEACAKAIEIMVPAFRQQDWISGLELGLDALAEAAGPGQASGEELPDILE